MYYNIFCKLQLVEIKLTPSTEWRSSCVDIRSNQPSLWCVQEQLGQNPTDSTFNFNCLWIILMWRSEGDFLLWYISEPLLYYFYWSKEVESVVLLLSEAVSEVSELLPEERMCGLLTPLRLWPSVANLNKLLKKKKQLCNHSSLNESWRWCVCKRYSEQRRK